MPIRGGYARNVFIVTSGEMMALYAASNIASAVKNFGKRGYAQYSGVILNSRNIENEEALVKKRWKRSARSCLFFREAHPFRKRKAEQNRHRSTAGFRDGWRY